MSENRIMECPGCGARITSSKRICDYCGSEIKVPEVNKESPDAAPESQGVQQTQAQVIPPDYNKSMHSQAPQKTLSGLAVAAFILSLVGLGPIAFILGIIASVRISNPNSNLTGRGFAVAAIIISIIQVIVFIIIGISTS